MPDRQGVCGRTRIDPAVLQSRDLFKTYHLDEADFEPRCFRVETTDQVGQGRVDGRGHEPDDKARPLRFTKAPHHRAQIVKTFQNLGCVLVEQAFGFGEAERATVSIE